LNRKSIPFPGTWWTALGSLVVVLTACSDTVIVEPFYRPESARVEQSFVSPDADFSRYTKLLAQPLEIYYPDNAPAPAEGDLDRLRQIFREAFLTELGDDYEIVQDPGPEVLTVLAQIIDLKVTGALGTYEPNGRLQYLVTKGQLTFLMELRDSQSDRVLARAGETEDGGTTSLTEAEASWAEVEVAAQRWAGLFRSWLDDNLGGRATG
jgi:hypothetical protein